MAALALLSRETLQILQTIPTTINAVSVVFVGNYVNDEEIRYLQKSDTPVIDADTLTIVPSIAGGSATLTEPVTAASADLTSEEILRYSRHLIMPEVGVEGQLKLKNAKVLIALTSERASTPGRELKD